MTTDTSRTDAPAPVRYAYLLWLGVVGLEVVNGVLGEIASPSTVTVDGAGGVAVLVLIAAVAVGVLALLVLFARRMRQGRNWARIVLAVLTVLSLIGVRDLFDPVTGAIEVVARGVSVVQTLAALVATVCAFLPASAPWFRRS